jgi:hypothetical protein
MSEEAGAQGGAPEAAPPMLPLELVDQCIGSKVWIVMKNEKGECSQRYCGLRIC